MPRSKAKPLTPEQQAAIYDDYNVQPTTSQPNPNTMMVLATKYNTSVSVIHRAIHNEAFRRATEPAQC